MRTLGFDFEAGRLDVSLHPFCGGVPGDVRITTRYTEDDFTESLLGMLGGQRPDFRTDEFSDNYVKQMLQDEKQREQLSSNAIEKKIMAAIRGTVKTKDKKLDADGFNELIKTFNEENTPASEEE